MIDLHEVVRNLKFPDADATPQSFIQWRRGAASWLKGRQSSRCGAHAWGAGAGPGREGGPAWLGGTSTAQHTRSGDFTGHWGDFSGGVAVVRPGQRRKQGEGWGRQVTDSWRVDLFEMLKSGWGLKSQQSAQKRGKGCPDEFQIWLGGEARTGATRD